MRLLKITLIVWGVAVVTFISAKQILKPAEQTTVTTRQAKAKDRIFKVYRNMYRKFDSVRIPHASNIYHIPMALTSNVLPETFEYDDDTCNVAEEIKETGMTSLIVIKNGKIITENYYHGNKASDLVIDFSVTKSVVSILVGMAYEKGKIDSLDDVAGKYAPKLKGTVYENVTIQNLLDMASGVKWSEDYSDGNSDIGQSEKAALTGSLDDFVKTLKSDRKQGEYNQYSSMNVHVLGMVLRGATGKPLNEYFKEKLWDKIGAEYDAYFLTDKTGSPLSYGGLVCSTIDLAKIGLLMINNGRNYQGKQLIPPQWIKASTTPDKPYLMPGEDNPNSDDEMGYKNLWWIPEYRDGDDYSAIGVYGQFLYINPSKHIVIASNSAYADYNDDEDLDYRRIRMFQTIANDSSK